MRRILASRVAAAVGLFFLLLGCYIYFLPRWADWNQNSRLDQVMAIVDQGILEIDAYVANTGDYAVYAGHYYSDKAPGTAFLGVPVYALYARLVAPRLEPLAERLANTTALAGTFDEPEPGQRLAKVRFLLALYCVTIVTVSVPSAALGVLLFHALALYMPSTGQRLLVTLIYALGTIALPYSTVFVGHQVAAAALFAAFCLFGRMRRLPPSVPALLVAGFLLGLATITEYDTVVVAAGVCLYGWRLLPRRPLLFWIVLGGLIPGLAAMVYNYAIFGTPLPVAYHYSANFPEHFRTGFMGLSLPRPEALWGLSFSPYRGLFFVSPIFLLGLAGLVAWVRTGPHRLEAITIAGVWLADFLLIASQAAWSGGYAIGPRYLAPILPFAMLPVGWWLSRHSARPWSRPIFALAAAASALVVWSETVGGQLFPDYTLNPLLDYSWPRILAGDIARNLGMVLRLRGATSLLPLLVFIVGMSVTLWHLNQFGTGRRAAAQTPRRLNADSSLPAS